jgi:exopolyphosphatase/guanosine-5'-triphosphate,3'-diphosphate pyrophosphatase
MSSVPYEHAACLILPETHESAAPTAPARVCVIDLGTNSFHAVIVDAYPNGTFRVVDRMKEMVRLGQRGLLTSVLPDDAMERGMKALHRIHLLASGWNVQEYLAFATSAIREAKNGGAFIERVREEIGIRIRAISGSQEARLIYEGVQRAVDMPVPTLIVDIGGGSVEFIVSTKEGVPFATSLKLGAARMTEQFVRSDPMSNEEQTALRAHYQAELKPVIAAARSHDVEMIVASSGTAKSLARVCVDKYGDPSRTVFQQDIEAAPFRETMTRILAAGKTARARMSGIGEKRVDQIGAGAILMDTLLEELPVDRLRISSHALREGMVVYFIEENYKRLRRLAPFADVRRRSVYEIGFRFQWEEVHCEHVATLALTLYDAIRPVLTGPPVDRELLEYAALLHDVGYHINHSEHHLHSQYLIENADVRGFQPDEVAIMANVARYHRNEHPRKKDPAYRHLTEAQQRRVCELASILRIAEGLDRSHFQNVVALRTLLDDDQFAITIETQGDPQLERWGGMKDRGLFEDTFARTVLVQPGDITVRHVPEATGADVPFDYQPYE